MSRATAQDLLEAFSVFGVISQNTVTLKTLDKDGKTITANVTLEMIENREQHLNTLNTAYDIVVANFNLAAEYYRSSLHVQMNNCHELKASYGIDFLRKDIQYFSKAYEVLKPFFGSSAEASSTPINSDKVAECYRILGITDTDLESRQTVDGRITLVKEAFKALSLKFHPDKLINVSEEEKNAAKERLSKLKPARDQLIKHLENELNTASSPVSPQTTAAKPQTTAAKPQTTAAKQNAAPPHSSAASSLQNNDDNLALTRLREELEKVRTQLESAHAQNRTLQCENDELKRANKKLQTEANNKSPLSNKNGAGFFSDKASQTTPPPVTTTPDPQAIFDGQKNKTTPDSSKQLQFAHPGTKIYKLGK